MEGYFGCEGYLMRCKTPPFREGNKETVLNNNTHGSSY